MASAAFRARLAILTIVLAGLLAAGSPASAQTREMSSAQIVAAARLRPAVLPSRASLEIQARAGVPDSVVHHTQPNQWVRGGIIGAGVGAVVFGAIGAAVCGLDEGQHSCGYYISRFALLGVPVGGVTGALIGSNIPKKPAGAASTD